MRPFRSDNVIAGVSGWASEFSRRRMIRDAVLSSVALACGCETSGEKGRGVKAPADSAPITNTDPCATRLHDICGAMLFYYATRHRLPPRLEELAELPGFQEIRDFTCPVSRQPYIYNPIGVVSSDQPTRVILYDPAPSHAGYRWAVSILEPQDAGPLVTKVIALPESYFTLNLRVSK